MPQLNRVLKNTKLTEIRKALSALQNLNSYISGDFGLTDSDFLPAEVASSDEPLTFENNEDKNKEDLSNSIMLHKRLNKLDPAKASDIRLWTYLAYHISPDYVRRRWPIKYDNLDSEKEEVKKEEAKKIATHWLFGSATDRALRRNALARLWWAAHLTYEPWEDPELKQFKKDDSYFYTSIIFRNQGVYSDLMERAFCRDKKILTVILDLFHEYPQLTERKYTRAFVKLVNINSGFKSLGALTVPQLKELLKGIKEKVFSTPIDEL